MPGNDEYTVLLTHCNGIDESTDFTDVSVGGDDSPHTITAHGNAQVDTAIKKFGTGSCLGDGVEDYLYATDSADWYFGTGAFTLDAWAMFDTGFTYTYLFSQFQDNTSNHLFLNVSTTAIAFGVWLAGVAKAHYIYNWSPSTDTWYHIALVRDGANLYLFINGDLKTWTSIGTPISTNEIPDFAGSFAIGGEAYTHTGSIKGWIDEPRVSKGIARWTESFTPSTEEYSVPVVSDILKVLGIAQADISKIAGVANASIKKVSGVSNV